MAVEDSGSGWLFQGIRLPLTDCTGVNTIFTEEFVYGP